MRKHGPASFVSTGVKIFSRRVARQTQAGSCGKGGASWPHGLFQRVRTSVSVTTAPPARRKPSVTISGGVGRALVRPQRLRRSAPQWGGRLSGRRHWRPHSGRCGGHGTSGTGRMVAAAAAGPSAGIRRDPELWRQATATSAQSAARGCVGHAPGPGRRLPLTSGPGAGEASACGHGHFPTSRRWCPPTARGLLSHPDHSSLFPELYMHVQKA